MAALTDGTAAGTINESPVVPAPYSPTAPAGFAPLTGNDTTAKIPDVTNPNAGNGSVASSMSALGSMSSGGLTASAVPTPSGYNPSKVTIPQLSSILGTNGFGDAQLKSYGITQNADGTYNVPQSALDKRSAELNQNAIVSTSASAVNNENNIAGAVRSLATNSNPITLPDGSVQNAKDAASQAIALIDNYTATLEARRKAQIDSINASFDQQQNQLENKQANETGAQSATIARVGGYLGDSGSGTGVMLNLAATHKQELLSLQSQRQKAVQDAQTAIDDKEFALAQQKVAQVQDLDKTIYQRQQDFFKNSIELQNATNTNLKAQQDQIDSTLKTLTSTMTDPTKVDQATKDKIDQFYGAPGFTDNYLKVANAAAAAKSLADRTKANSDMMDLLQKIPAGQKVTFPDGTQYTGIGAAGDIATFMEVDNNGIGHLITYNKRTQQTTAQSVGAVGKDNSGSSAKGGVNGVAPTVVDNVTAIIQTGMEKAKDAKTGQYDPDVYIAARTELKKTYPQLLSYMDNIFLNPSNKFFSTAGITELRQKGIAYKALPTVDPAAAAADAAAANQDQTQSDNAP